MTDAADQASKRPRAMAPYLLLAVLALAGGATAWASSRSSVPSSTIGPEGVLVDNVANLAPSSTTLAGQPVDGITCQSQFKEVVKYHIHVHLVIFVDGQMVRLPAGIGITQPSLVEKLRGGDFYDVGAKDCLYWLHTHVADGIIHVESPVKEGFTLGQFFDVWNQPLSATRVGEARGPVVVFENGRRVMGDPRLTPLLSQGDIQIDVGTPVVAFRPFHFTVTGGCGEGTNSCSSPIG